MDNLVLTPACCTSNHKPCTLNPTAFSPVAGDSGPGDGRWLCRSANGALVSAPVCPNVKISTFGKRS